jgi:carbon-monoxide dehydrogenase medium subunit
MKPAAFDYERPESLDEALEVLARYGDEAKVIAGGQSLLPLLAMRLARPAQLIDVNRLSELADISSNGQLEIGALVRQRVAERSPLVREVAPIISEALTWVAHPQIRNRGTVGGSLAHADPAAELPTVMTALNASLVIQKAGGGRRAVSADDFFQGFFTTAIEADELLTAIHVPLWPVGTGYGWRELSRRHGDFALVGVAAVLTVEGGVIRSARVALSGVGPAPVRARDAEALLVGHAPATSLWAAAAAEAAREIQPTADIQGSADYRRRVANKLVAEALRDAAGDGEAGGDGSAKGGTS